MSENLVPIPTPTLISILLNKEKKKGSPLTEEEVLEIRDNAVFIMMPLEHKILLEKSRGYADLDLDLVWENWQKARIELIEYL